MLSGHSRRKKKEGGINIKKRKKPSKGLERQKPVIASVENFLNEFFNCYFYPGKLAGQTPSVNIAETDQSYSIEVSAPGFEKKDFNVKVEDGMLIISGEHKTEKKDEEKNFVRREFNYGSFSRSFNLADSIDE